MTTDQAPDARRAANRLSRSQQLGLVLLLTLGVGLLLLRWLSA